MFGGGWWWLGDDGYVEGYSWGNRSEVSDQHLCIDRSISIGVMKLTRRVGISPFEQEQEGRIPRRFASDRSYAKPRRESLLSSFSDFPSSGRNIPTCSDGRVSAIDAVQSPFPPRNCLISMIGASSRWSGKPVKLPTVCRLEGIASPRPSSAAPHCAHLFPVDVSVLSRSYFSCSSLRAVDASSLDCRRSESPRALVYRNFFSPSLSRAADIVDLFHTLNSRESSRRGGAYDCLQILKLFR